MLLLKKYLHRTISMLFLAAFAGVGLYGKAHSINRLPVIPNTGPHCCIDAELKTYFGSSNGTQILDACLAHVPPEKPIIIFYPKSVPTTEIPSLVVSKAIWPRKTLVSPVSMKALPVMIDGMMSYNVGGMFFCYIPPLPSLPTCRQVFPMLTFLSGTGKSQ